MKARTSYRTQNTGQLAESSGLSHSGVSKKLATAGLQPIVVKGQTKYFDAPQALRLLLAGEDLDPQRERARLDRVRAETAEHELARRRGEFIATAEAEKMLVALGSATSANLAILPGKLAQSLAAETSPARCEALLDAALREALDELCAAADEARAG